jgi:penicillin-binding protein 2
MTRRPARVLSRRFLPPDPRVEEPYRLTPKLALRIGMLGMLAVAVFAVLFLRLWSLQVLNGEKLLRAAQNNQRREVPIPAPRGPILDRNGQVLVTNVPGTAVRVWLSDLPKRRSARLREIRALARVLHIPARQIGATLRRHRNDLITPVKIKEGVTESQVRYLKERSEDFPGVRIEDTYLRYYPHRELAAHLLGYVSEISAQQLKELRQNDYRSGDTIGQTGVEAYYDKYLRGIPGEAQLRVDALGRRRGPVFPKTPPQSGNALRLTLDLRLQIAAEQAIRYGIERARNSACYGCWYANGGAIVALDPRDGSIRALASYPTYPPSVYVGRVRRRALDAAGLTARTAEAMNFPGLDRAIDAAYPPGSTFKPVTAIAAMQEHILQPYEALSCTGSYEKNGTVFKNWDPFVNESMTLPTALARSCDTYFYQVGYRFYGMPSTRGPRLQAWSSRFGFGKRSGIDLTPERTGLLPTPDWRKKTYTKKTDPRQWQIDSLWKPGDSIQLAIGQKDLLVTPMQMARFYAMIANGGRLVTPHLLLDVEQPPSNGRRGRTVAGPQPPPPPEATNVDAQALAVVRDGLYQATHYSFGTSAAIFSGFPISISGKTGTAEKIIDPGDGYPRTFNQSWWCGYGPSDSPDLVVCALIENGGHGGDAAAPAALKVFEAFFGKEAVQHGPIHSD